MKNRISILIICLFTLILYSCSKTKSADPPLPKERKEAVIVAANNSTLISYDANKGTKLWEAVLSGNCKGTPVLYQKKVYVHTDNAMLYAINVIDGKIEKSLSTSFMSSPFAIAQYGDKLYFASDKLYCIDTAFNPVWEYDGGVACSSSPQFYNDKIYVAMGDKINCVDLSGNNVWQSAAVGAGIITSSVKVIADVVYFGAQDKKIYALNANNGAINWYYTTLDKVESSPMVYGGMCIIGGSDYNLYCLDIIDGSLRWKYHTLERVVSSPTVHSSTNTIIVGSYDFNLYGIDHVSGKLKWKYPAASLIKSSPVVMGNLSYFTSYDKYLYCIDCRDGSLVWKVFLNANSEGSPIVDNTRTGLYSSESGMSEY